MKLSAVSVKHPVIVAMLLMVILVFGGLALFGLKQELLPELELPKLLVISSYPGGSAQDVEDQLTKPLEKQFVRLSGLKEISSRSLPGTSIISLSFDWGQSAQDRIPEVRELINRSRSSLPDDLPADPVIRLAGTSEITILSFSLESNQDPGLLSDYIDQTLIPELSVISGVASVEAPGLAERRMGITLDLEQLSARGIGVNELMQSLRAQNIVAPAGDAEYESQRVNVRSRGDFQDPEQILRTPVAVRNGVSIQLGELASLSEDVSKPDRVNLLDGQEILILEIKALPGADKIQISKEVSAVLKDQEASYGSMYRFSILSDQKQGIEQAVASVKNAALSGGILAVIIIFLFLAEVSATIIIAFSIPLSIVGTLIFLYAGGHTLNLLTLGGLTMAIGMVVDATIVMLENIWRHRSSDTSPEDAAIRAAGEVTGALIASVSTSLAVFVPLIFVQGIAGLMLKDLALTVVYALISSLVLAIFVIPALSVFVLRRFPPKNTENKSRFRQGLERILQQPQIGVTKLERAYSKALDLVLRHKVFFLSFAGALLFFSISLFSRIGFEFMPTLDEGELVVELKLPYGTSLDKTVQAVKDFQKLLKDTVPEVEYSYITAGKDGSQGLSSQSNAATGTIILSPAQTREASIMELSQRIQNLGNAEIPDLTVRVRPGGQNERLGQALGGSGYRLRISGFNSEELAKTALAVQSLVSQDPEVLSADFSFSLDNPALEAIFDLDSLSALGLNQQDIAYALRVVLNGADLGDYRGKTFSGEPGPLPLEVLPSLPQDVLDESSLNQIPLRSRTGHSLALAAVSNLEKTEGFSELDHINRRTYVDLVIQLKTNDFRAAQERIFSVLEGYRKDQDILIESAGSASETLSSFKSLLSAILLGIFLVYAVMVIQFERFRQPLIILMSIPFVFIGVFLGLLAFHSSLSVIAFLGIITLAGTVVNNAIVLVEYLNILRFRDGLSLEDALIKGSCARLRPILMTTLTTVLGVIPLALGSGGGTDMLAPLGQVLVGGLSTSTIITLFIVPVLYYISEKKAAPAPVGTNETNPVLVPEEPKK